MNRARISDLSIRLEMSQKQVAEKTQQLDQKRHLFESKSAELEDLKVKFPQARRKLEFEIETIQKNIWQRLQERRLKILKLNTVSLNTVSF